MRSAVTVCLANVRHLPYFPVKEAIFTTVFFAVHVNPPPSTPNTAASYKQFVPPGRLPPSLHVKSAKSPFLSFSLFALPPARFEEWFSDFLCARALLLPLPLSPSKFTWWRGGKKIPGGERSRIKRRREEITVLLLLWGWPITYSRLSQNGGRHGRRRFGKFCGLNSKKAAMAQACIIVPHMLPCKL